MFSKKPALAAVSASAPSARAGGLGAQALAAVSNPYVGAGGAAFLFLLAVAGLVFITGNPQAGAPLVRVSLTKIGATKDAPTGWREALAPEPQGEAHLTPDTFELSAHPLGDIAPENQAVITLPDGGSVEGGVTHAGLAAAPLPGLSAPGPSGGLLPVIAPDGRNSAQAYARPFASNGSPRVALIVGGLGLNPQTTRAAIETLPPEITLSFAPYADDLQGWIDMARAAGHEVLLEAPMEPADYPANDPGPYTLLAAARPEDTARKLEWLLSRGTGYFGVTNYLGSRFLNNDAAMNSFSSALGRRGVAFIDDGQGRRRGGGVMRASADRLIDEQLSAEAIDRQLSALEANAFKSGQALGSGFAYPVTLSAINRWASTLGTRGLQLAPASATMARR
jgi:polysaccharide deacetylase 2 family uncharacterized protein YibQ